MRVRTVTFSIILAFLFIAPVSAQQYYRPHYTQRNLPELQTAPVFLENRTGGHLRVRVEVNGLTYTVEVEQGKEVPDLMLPVGAVAKVKDARAVVLDNGKMRSKKAECYAYWREDSNGRVQQGWLFYMDKYFRP